MRAAGNEAGQGVDDPTDHTVERANDVTSLGEDASLAPKTGPAFVCGRLPGATREDNRAP